MTPSLQSREVLTACIDLAAKAATPASTATMRFLGILFTERGETDKSVRLYQAAMALEPGLRASTFALVNGLLEVKP